MPSILFVCLGNICRSPTAEAVFRYKVEQSGLDKEIDIRIDSAGTSAAHHGEGPDKRSILAGQGRGYSFEGQQSRPVRQQDFHDFDYVLAMDSRNLQNLRRIKPAEAQTQPQLFLNFAETLSVKDVPDPYYGGTKGFDHVLDLIEVASDGLIDHLRAKT